MRWKAHFFLNENKPTKSENKFGLPSRNYATPISEMKAFEDDLVKLTSSITFREVKMYKFGNKNVTDDINDELRNIASNLSIGNRVDTMAKRSAYITFKDHKENFESNPKFRLINPAKSEIIFNRNNIKVSYLCMDNVKSNITLHNHHLLTKTSTVPKPKECDCRKANVCSLDEKCLTSDVVNKAEITTHNDGTTKEYIGMTSTEFKVRYRNHKKSFNKPTHSSDTELSKYVWDLKDKKREYSIKWSILKRAAAYVPGGSRYKHRREIRNHEVR